MTKPNSKGGEAWLGSIVSCQSTSGHAGRGHGANPRVRKWMAALLTLPFLVSIGARDARAQIQVTDNWNGGSGFWNNAANWDSGIPNNGGGNYYDVVINGTGSDTITFDAGPTVVDTVTLGTGETLQDNGSAVSLTIGDPTAPGSDTIGILTNAGTINWGNGSTLTINSSVYGSINNTGAINLTSSTLTVNDSGHGNFTYLYDGGTVTLSAATINGANGTEILWNEDNTISGSGLVAGLTVINGGTINASGGDFFLQPGAGQTVTTNNIMTVASGATLHFDYTDQPFFTQAFSNSATGTITVNDGSTLEWDSPNGVSPVLNNDGQISLSAPQGGRAAGVCQILGVTGH